MDFIDSLGWSDIIHPGDVWDRAKRIFTDPIDRLVAFFKELGAGIIELIKTVILKPLAALASKTKAWDLLVGVLGHNPITKEPAEPAPDLLIGGLMKLAGQEDVWEKIQKANALQRIWSWFKKAVGELIGFVREVPGLFIAAVKSFVIEDLLDLPGALARVVGMFADFVGKFIHWGLNAAWTFLEIVIDVVSPQALVYIKKTGAALKSILKNPLPFVGNLVKAAKLGLQNFADHFGTHLKEGLIAWLTGALQGVYLPKALSLVEIGKFVLSVLGLAWAQIRAKIVKALGPTGEKIMSGLEKAADFIVALVTGGPAALWELIKEKLTDLKDAVIDGIKGFVESSIVKVAIPKLVAMFIPGAGFISAIISIYGTIKSFIEQLGKIAAAITAFIDSIVAIAEGRIEGAANKVENALANVIAIAIGLLAGFLGLGGISSKVMDVVKKVQATVDKALDAAIAWLIDKAKAAFAWLFGSVKAAAQGIVNWWSGRKSFTASDDLQHSLYFDGAGPDATLTVSTIPTPVEAFLANVAPAVNASTDTKAKSDLAEAQSLWGSSIKASIRKLNAFGAAAPTPADVDNLNQGLQKLADLLRSLIVFDPRSAAAPPGEIPVKVNDLIKLI